MRCLVCMAWDMLGSEPGHSPLTDMVGQDVSMMVRDLVLSAVEDPAAADNRALAAKMQALVNGVSYSSEMKDPEAVKELIAKIPELAIVQVGFFNTS